MTELDEINKEIRKLQRERNGLEQIRQAKIKRFGLKVSNIPTRFSAKHPILAGTGKLIITGFKAPVKLGEATGRKIDEFSKEEHPVLEGIGRVIMENYRRNVKRKEQEREIELLKLRKKIKA